MIEKAKIIKNGNVMLENIVVTPSVNNSKKHVLKYIKLLGCNTITVDRNTLKTAKKLALNDVKDKIKLVKKIHDICEHRGFIFSGIESELKELKEMEANLKLL
jgi:hypothetical protein